MNRREFLKYVALLGASATVGKTSAYANWLTNKKRNGFPQGMLLIDAHAHLPVLTPTNFMKTIGMNASGLAMVEDKRPPEVGIVELDELIARLNIVLNFENTGAIKIIKTYSDLPYSDAPYFNPPPDFVPGVILAVEGATPLGMDLNNVNELYDLGVRLITPMHYWVNHIGDIMTEAPVNGGLTVIGQQIVERMMELGIIVDVAHAHIDTLQGIAKIARTNGIPIIDSHTSLTHRKKPYGTTRLRTIKEMKIVAKTGGVVCTWPLGWYVNDSQQRTTFLDWAEENLEIAREIGIEHIGLGTDGGGGLPDLIDGYESILDLPKLVEAMDEVGFKRSEIAAYLGGNLFRVIKQCIG